MQRITITVPEATVTAVRARVAEGGASSVSAFFSAAAEEAAREDGLTAWLDQLDAELGPPDEEAQAWADDVMQTLREMDSRR